MSISALIPTYNRREYIQRSIESVLAQSVPVDEIVVVDDGSTDGTSEFLRSMYGQKIRLIEQKNGGVSRARRRAIEEAKGTWVAFLDSDDEWTPDRNRILTEMLGKVPEKVAWIFGDLQVVTDKAEEKTLFQNHGLQVRQSVEVFKDPLKIHHPFQFCMLQASLIRRDVLLALNCFTEGLRHSEDVLAGYQVATNYEFAATPFIVTRLYRTSDLSTISLTTDERLRPDYYRARMLAFSLTVQSTRKQPWSELYADAVRGLCKYRADNELPIRKLALQQFKHSYSLKSVLFLCLALPGSKFLRELRLAFRQLRNKRDRSRLLPRPLPE
jgi:glycosyltransferase involved in cell wall biosynthesis